MKATPIIIITTRLTAFVLRLLLLKRPMISLIFLMFLLLVSILTTCKQNATKQI